jgi:hypothetical protein
MIQSIKRTVHTAGSYRLLILASFRIVYANLFSPLTLTGARGLFDGISGTWLRQMTYSMCRFWAYDQSKKILGAGKDAPALKLAAAGTMGERISLLILIT